MDAGSLTMDASAILALLQGERGGDVVRGHLADSLISTVNLAEVVQRLRRSGHDVEPRLDLLRRGGLQVVPASESHGIRAGELEMMTRTYGLSLADRFCIALAIENALPILTADKPFSALGLPVQVIQFR